MLIKDKTTWNKILEDRKGFVYNDFGTQFPGDSLTWNTTDFNKLHRASCSQVKRMTYITNGKFTKYHFNTKQEAINWLMENRENEGYTFCKFCNP